MSSKKFSVFLLLCIFASYLPKVESVQFNNIGDRALNKVGDFGKQLAKKHNLIYLNKGVGTVVDSNQIAYDLSLMGNQNLNRDQARFLAIHLIQEFWNKITSDPIFDQDTKHYASLNSWYDPILTPKRIGLKIAFWDPQVNRYPPPYISRIIVADGFIKYYEANPKDQSLQEPFVETIEETFSRAGVPPLS